MSNPNAQFGKLLINPDKDHTPFSKAIMGNQLDQALALVEQKQDSLSPTQSKECALHLLRYLRQQMQQLEQPQALEKTLNLLQAVRLDPEKNWRCELLKKSFLRGEVLQFKADLSTLIFQIETNESTICSIETIDSTFAGRLASANDFAQRILFYSNEASLPSQLKQAGIVSKDWKKLGLLQFVLTHHLLHALQYFFQECVTIFEFKYHYGEECFDKFIIEMVAQGNLELLKVVLKQYEKEFTSSENSEGYAIFLSNLLHVAIELKQMTVVQYLVEEKNARITPPKTENDPDPLAHAIKFCRPIAIYLIDQGVRPNPKHAFLAIKVARDSIDDNLAKAIIQSLVARGVNLINFQDMKGRNVLHYAAKYGRVHVAKCILEGGTEEEKQATLVNKETTTANTLSKTTSAEEWLESKDDKGKTPMDIARSNYSLAVRCYFDLYQPPALNSADQSSETSDDQASVRPLIEALQTWDLREPQAVDVSANMNSNNNSVQSSAPAALTDGLVNNSSSSQYRAS